MFFPVLQRMLREWPSKKSSTILVMRLHSGELMENPHLMWVKAMDFVTLHLRKQVGSLSGFMNHVFRVKVWLFAVQPSGEAAEKAPTNPNPVGQVHDGQWMTQSFADQIPDIGGSSQAQTWGVWGRTMTRDFMWSLLEEFPCFSTDAVPPLSEPTPGILVHWFPSPVLHCDSLLHFNYTILFRRDMWVMWTGFKEWFEDRGIMQSDLTCTRRVQWLLKRLNLTASFGCPQDLGYIYLRRDFFAMNLIRSF